MESLDALAFIVSPIKTGLSKGHPRMTFCFQNYCEKKKCSRDRKKFLIFEAEGREFAKFLRSLEQFIQTVKGQNNFW